LRHFALAHFDKPFLACVSGEDVGIGLRGISCGFKMKDACLLLQVKFEAFGDLPELLTK
jgi:hypothetical protein